MAGRGVHHPLGGIGDFDLSGGWADQFHEGQFAGLVIERDGVLRASTESAYQQQGGTNCDQTIYVIRLHSMTPLSNFGNSLLFPSTILGLNRSNIRHPRRLIGPGADLSGADAEPVLLAAFEALDLNLAVGDRGARRRHSGFGASATADVPLGYAIEGFDIADKNNRKELSNPYLKVNNIFNRR
jgi:hypothetical protein